LRYVAGIEQLSSLKELYLSDNLISKVGSLVHLRGCTKLQSICLTGNPLADRLYRPAILMLSAARIKKIDGRVRLSYTSKI